MGGKPGVPRFRDTKPITKIGDPSQILTNNACPGGTRAIDVDLIYKLDFKWVVIEFLRCETVRPIDSHPRRYWFNWRKFVRLWSLAADLSGRLLLVNYETVPPKAQVPTDFGQIVVLEVSMDPNKRPTRRVPVSTSVVFSGAYEEFCPWFRNIDRRAEKML